ncbi:MAG: DUF3180 domain-containing protein [Actinomycetota bacterium]|nr:DUF3180 domain-containing protein [Geodermatophilaceae bacterium]MDQ3505218.1 DUF3180 domain-containing protein [Actinomycetota bacterium]
MSATKPRDLALIGLFAAVVGWLLVRQYYGDLPPLRWYLPLSLAALGIAELIGARSLRSRIRGSEGLTPVDAVGAAGAVALAKASAVSAAGFLGLWVGLLAYTVPNLGFLAAAGNDTVTGVVGIASSGLLVAGALVLEDACRTPEPPKDSDWRN